MQARHCFLRETKAMPSYLVVKSYCRDICRRDYPLDFAECKPLVEVEVEA